MDMDFATSCPLVRPVLPHIRLLFVRSRFRSTLPSDGPSRFRPCASLVLHLHQVAQGTFTPRLLDMPSTQDATRRQGGGLKAVLDRGLAHRRRDLRPGRRNGPVQPNQETSLATMPRLLHNLTDTTPSGSTSQRSVRSVCHLGGRAEGQESPKASACQNRIAVTFARADAHRR
jgi:hypothetical protein